ncbi:MAG: glycosyltransferase, partial [Proteobacteria bacterium]
MWARDHKLDVDLLLESVPFARFGALEDLAELRSSIEKSSSEWAAQIYKPLVSIIMPSYNSDPAQFEQAITSVFAQSYPNWELVIVDDGSLKTDYFFKIAKYQEVFSDRLKFIK